MRIDALLREARARLDAGEAEMLLAHVLARPSAWLFAHGDAVLDAGPLERFHSLVSRRIDGTPIAYLVGRRGFWTFDLDVTPATLIPRPETERLVELALERIATGPADVADLGTGSGAVGIALAAERPQARVVATDASEAALEVARGNAARLVPGRIDCRLGDWYAPLQGERFDLIASNPPYIAAGDPHLARGDLRHEPVTALTPGGDGLSAIRVLASGAVQHLKPGGWLLVEHGFDQAAAARAIFLDAGLRDVSAARDLEHRDRVTLGRAP